VGLRGSYCKEYMIDAGVSPIQPPMNLKRAGFLRALGQPAQLLTLDHSFRSSVMVTPPIKLN